MSEQDERGWVVLAGVHMNLAANLVHPAPPGLNHFLRSQPTSYAEACALKFEWMTAVESPGWRFDIVKASEIDQGIRAMKDPT